MTYYTSKEIKPSGWLKKQLRVQAEGLSGNLHKIWHDIRDSSWIGGDADASDLFERVPYWLDGFIPLAYLLEDEELIAGAKKYIDAIISSQREDGWICPPDTADIDLQRFDSWAIQLISKVLVVYYECSGDERIPGVLYRAMKNYYDLLKSEKLKLFDWGQFRFFETFIALDFLWKRNNEAWIKELAKLLDSEGFDYDTAVPRWKFRAPYWNFNTHVVNLAMLIKLEAVSDTLLDGKYKGKSYEYYETLMEYNGTPLGIFNGDECVAGISPIAGTELCSVAELMYSFEKMYEYSGDAKWAELLESVCFNAFFATVSDDMWTHQYDQLTNQINCIRFDDKPIFTTNHEDAHLFGLEPNYGCCTANFSQALPKFTLSLFLHDENEDTVVSAVPAPCELHSDNIDITVSGEYPFRNKLLYKAYGKKSFTLKIKVPTFADAVTVNGKCSQCKDFLIFPISAGEEFEISVEFTFSPKLCDSNDGMKVVKYGSLVFSLPVYFDKKMYEYTRDGVERKYPYCDYELIGKTDWQYAFASGELSVSEKEISDIPFSMDAPPLTVTAELYPINWGFEDGFPTVCAKFPKNTSPTGEKVKKELIPYGCAKLRMTEMPCARKEN